MIDSPAIDSRLCPLCGQPNGCAMEAAKTTGQSQPPCWCAQVTMNAAALAALPPQARGRACLCRACAAGSGLPKAR